MTAMHYIFAAFAFIWAGALFYMVRVSALRRELETRVQRLEERIDNGGRDR